MNYQTNLLSKIQSADELDESISAYIAYRRCQRSHPPSVTIPGSQANHTSREVKEAIHIQRKLRHRWQNTRDPALKSEFSRTYQRVRYLIRQSNNTAFSEFLLILDATENTNYSLYRVAKAARKPPNYIPPSNKSILG